MRKLSATPSPILDGNGLGKETETLFPDDTCLMPFQEIVPELYALKVRDFIHDLSCNMILAVKKILVFPDDEDDR